MRPRLEHRKVSRLNNGDAIDGVRLCPLERHEFNLVADSNVLQPAEESISMPSDRHVAVLSWIGGTGYVSNSPVQDQIVRSLQNRSLNVNLGNAQDADGRREMLRQALLVPLDTFL